MFLGKAHNLPTGSMTHFWVPNYQLRIPALAYLIAENYVNFPFLFFAGNALDWLEVIYVLEFDTPVQH